MDYTWSQRTECKILCQNRFPLALDLDSRMLAQEYKKNYNADKYDLLTLTIRVLKLPDTTEVESK